MKIMMKNEGRKMKNDLHAPPKAERTKHSRPCFQIVHDDTSRLSKPPVDRSYHVLAVSTPDTMPPAFGNEEPIATSHFGFPALISVSTIMSPYFILQRLPFYPFHHLFSPHRCFPCPTNSLLHSVKNGQSHSRLIHSDNFTS